MITGSPRTHKYKSRREKRRRKSRECGEQPERVRACRWFSARGAHRRKLLYGQSSIKILSPALVAAITRCSSCQLFKRASRNYTCVCFCALDDGTRVQGLADFRSLWVRWQKQKKRDLNLLT